MELKELCATVPKEYKAQVETLVNAVLALQSKIEEMIPLYQEAELVMEGTGKMPQRANPLSQEFRATVKDYSAALNALLAIAEKNGAEPAVSLDEFRNRFKVV